MSSSLSKKELYALTLAKLKELAKEYNIPGRSTYNASNKNELADKIHSAMKKRAKAAAGPIPVVPVVIDPPAAGELGCDMPQKTCETSSKYKKPDILALAKKCGVTNLDGTRKELCARIAQRLGPVPEPGPVAPEPQPVAPPLADDDCNMPQKTCETSSKYKKPDILALAKKCGVTNLEGTRKELCARIAAKMAGMVQPEPAPQPAPVVGGELDCNMPQKTCETSSKYKKNDILDLAKRCGVTDLGGTRKDLCARIAARMAAGVVPEPPEPEPVVPEPVVPEPEPVVPEPVGPDCYGGKTYEELIKLKVDELRELMNKADIMKNKPSDKKGMAAYLCAVKQNGRCDPEKGVDCDGDLVCDAQAKVCLNKELAAQRNQEIVEINGKTIVGTKASINQLRKKLAATPAPQPAVVPPPPPGPQVPAPLEPVGPDCYGGKTYEELINLKVDELRELMNKADIMKNKPSDKKGMAAYLCAVKQNGRCDPEKGVDCDGDLVCDAQAKVCLNKELAAQRNQEIVEINGKTIVGTKASINQLRKKLAATPAPQPAVVPPPQPGPQVPAPQVVVPQVVDWEEPQTPPKPPTPDGPPPPGPQVPAPQVVVPPPPPALQPEKPVHGQEVVDIEEVLRQIQAGGDVGDISTLSETQKAVFKCLGLIA